MRQSIVWWTGRTQVDPSLEPLKARRLALQLRERIASGEIAPGSRLASEPALALEHGVSRVTVRRALDSLAAEGSSTVASVPAPSCARPKRPSRSSRISRTC